MENVSYFPSLLYLMNNPNPINEPIPNIKKFIGADESMLAGWTLQFTKHWMSWSWLTDFHPKTVLGAKIKATKTKATMIFIH